MPEENNEPEVTIESLQAQMLLQAESIESMTTQNETLAADNEKWQSKQKETEKQKKAQDRAAKEAIAEAARKSGDIVAIEESWQDKNNTLETSWSEKYSEKEKSHLSEVNTLNSVINSITVGAEARAMAQEIAISGSAEVLQPILESRLYMEMTNGQPLVKVYQNGKPSALTLNDLKEEIMTNKAFAPVVRGSSASGAGAAGNNSGASGATMVKRAEFESMDQPSRAKFLKEGGKII